MKYRCRCSAGKCRTRKTLRKHPDEYTRLPICPGCGGKTWTVDAVRQRKAESDRGRPCHCDGRPYTHRYGQTGCNHREDHVIHQSLTTAHKATDDTEIPF